MKDNSIYDYCIDNLNIQNSQNKFSEIKFNDSNIYDKIRQYTKQYFVQVDANKKKYNYGLYEFLFVQGSDYRVLGRKQVKTKNIVD